MKLLLTLAAVILLFLCAWNGYKKGLILGVLSLIAFIVSVYAADLLSTTYSYEVINALRPFASGYLETSVNSEVRQSFGIEGSTTASLSVADYLEAHPEDAELFCSRTYEAVGIYTPTAAQMAKEAQDYATQQDTTVENAMVEVLCQRVTYAAGFILAFLMVIIAITVIGSLPNLGFKIPNLELLNDIGGLVTGVLQGLALWAVFCWVLKFTGLLIPQDMLAENALTAIMMQMDPLHAFLGI